MASGTVKIGRRHYRVRKAKIRKNWHSYCDIVKKDICLAHNIKSNIAPSALLHELMHAMFAEYMKTDFSEKEEEEIINAFDRGFSLFAKHNKEAWIMLAIRMAGVK